MDSVQVYKGLDIGSAKVSSVQRSEVPHHLLDICEVDVCYTAAQFCVDASAVIADIRRRGKIALIVGGTFLYLQAFLLGLTPMPEITDDARYQLAALNLTSVVDLWNFLQGVDSDSASRIAPLDRVRVERALLIYFSSGKPMSMWQRKARCLVHKYHGLQCVLLPLDRVQMRQVLAARFTVMLSMGLIEEVKTCWKVHPNLTVMHPSMRAIGYRQVSAYLHGQMCYDQMCQAGITATRRYFKRQLTWLRHMKGIDQIFHGAESWYNFWDC